MNSRRPVIGVFDSGFGGLTVLKALLEVLPQADYLYFGDTARLPYGSKSAETVARYAISSAQYLQRNGAEHLVIACNTASALALDAIANALGNGADALLRVRDALARPPGISRSETDARRGLSGG